MSKAMLHEEVALRLVFTFSGVRAGPNGGSGCVVQIRGGAGARGALEGRRVGGYVGGGGGVREQGGTIVRAGDARSGCRL